MRPLIDHWSLAVHHPVAVEEFQHRILSLVCAVNGYYEIAPSDIAHSHNCCRKAPPVWTLIDKALPHPLELECWDGVFVAVIAAHRRQALGVPPFPADAPNPVLVEPAPPARRRGTQQLLEAVMARHRAVIRHQQRQDRRRGQLE